MINAAAVKAFEVELTAKRIIAEWLAKWFDGSAHLIPGQATPVLFPLVAVGFDSSAPPQPLDGVDGCEIRVLTYVGANRKLVGGSGWDSFQHVRFDFYVRASLRGNADAGGGQALAMQVSGLLFGILDHPHCHADPDTPMPRPPELGRLGLTHIRPRAPQLVSMFEYACRHISCTAQLIYTVYDANLAGPSGVAPDSGVQ